MVFQRRRKKGRIKKGQFADLIVPDRDYFTCPEHEISEVTSDLTMSAAKLSMGLVILLTTITLRLPRHCLTGHQFARLEAMVLGMILGSESPRPAKKSRVPAAAPMHATFTAMTMLLLGQERFRYPI
jgi:hypothetical protein